MEDIRLRIVQGLRDKLKEITIANGYRFDMQDSVFINRAFFGDNDPLPMISILEPPIQPATIPPSYQGNVITYDYNLIVQGFMKDERGKDTEAEQAYRLMSDVKRILACELKGQQSSLRARDIFGVGSKLSDVQIAAGSVRPPDEVSNKAYFWLNLTMKVSEDMINPFE
jgi:hypothetical protein